VRTKQAITDFTGGRISRRLGARTGSDRYKQSAFTLDNWIVLREGGVFRRPGFEYIAQFDPVQSADNDVLRCINFVGEDNDVCLIIGASRMWAVEDGELVWFTAPSASPYKVNEIWDVQYAQDREEIWFFHPSYAPRKLTRTATGPSQFELTLPELDEIPQHNFRDATSPEGEGLTLEFDFTGTWNDGDKFGVDIPTIRPGGDGGVIEVEYSTTPAIMRQRLEERIYFGIQVAVAPLSILLGIQYSEVTVTGDGPYIVQVVPDNGITADEISISVGDIGVLNTDGLVISPATGTQLLVPEDAWSNERGWPAFGVFHEQRLILSGHPQLPGRIWGSRVGKYTDFAPGPYDSDPWEFDLVAKGRPDVRWMASSRRLVVGTQAGEFVQLNAPLTPTSPYFVNQTAYRSASVRPLQVNAETLYCTVGGRKLRNLTYSDERQSYQSADLAYSVSDWTSSGIVDMAYAQEPDSIIWCVTRDGVLIGLTYDPELGVLAWHRHYTLGRIKSVCVTHQGGYDNVYVITARDGVWCLLRMRYSSEDFITEGAALDHVGIETGDRVNSDTFIDYWREVAPVLRSDGVALPVVGGDLQGYELEAVFDGARTGTHELVTQEIVVPGDSAPDRAVVGIPYRSVMVPTPLEGADYGTSQVNHTRFAQLFLRLVESAMPTVDGIRPEERFPSDPMGEEPPLFTGDVLVAGVESTRPHSMRIESDLPYPCYIAGFFGVVESNED